MNSVHAAAPPTTGRILRYDTVVIGAGQAGLAMGYHLVNHAVDFVILDASPRVGDSWRNRWDSLRLLTPARWNGLPGMPFPDAPSHFPDKDQVADYLERYVQRFELPIRLNTRATALRGDGPDFAIHTANALFSARNVVVATGPFQRPRIPAFAARLGAHIRQMHSSEYRNPFDLTAGTVLVVGAGNAGAQISIELSRFHEVILAGPDIARLPRKILGLDVFHWLWPVFRQQHRGTWLGGRLRGRLPTSDPLIGITGQEFARHGIRRVGRITEARDGLPWASGDPLQVQTVIWATGFDTDFSWIELPTVDLNRTPSHSRGVTPTAGLYFVGLPFLHRLSSALLGGVGDDAEYIAGHIARRD